MSIEPSVSRGRLLRGGASGLAAGLVFGAMMQMQGMIPMIAMLVGSESLVVGWIVHLAISFVFGAIFGAAVVATGWEGGVAFGLAWGFVLWVGAGMLVMRTVMDMPIAVDRDAQMSLAGHLAYGLVLGIAYVALSKRAPEARVAGAAH
ncbi:MAG: hypothetical protein ACT4PT_06190 [Methanobacteriota archaeon]